MAGYILHGHLESGSCYKVARMLALCGAPYKYRHVALSEGEARGLPSGAGPIASPALAGYAPANERMPRG